MKRFAVSDAPMRPKPRRIGHNFCTLHDVLGAESQRRTRGGPTRIIRAAARIKLIMCNVAVRRARPQKEDRVEERHLMPDNVHMMISIPPKYAVSQVIGYIKAKSAIHLARVYGERKRNFTGSTSGRGDTSSRRSVETKP